MQDNTTTTPSKVTRTDKGITFKVADVTFSQDYKPSPLTDFKAYLNSAKIVTDNKGTILLNTEPEAKPLVRLRGSHNGFVSAALDAYSYHLHLILRPDDIWIAITTSLARHINKHSEVFRPIFVNHEGQVELQASSSGSITSTNYDSLVEQIVVQLDKNTKDDIVPWMTCNFSTTTKKDSFVSKLVLMGAMKKYFTYKFNLCCGLPEVTLEGTVEDWKEIRQRVNRFEDWPTGTMKEWGEVLCFVLDEFVRSAEGNPDVDFWNRIATIEGGGSGPRMAAGWILAFIAFDEDGNYFLNDIDTMQRDHNYGLLNVNDVPGCTVDVPVTIDDNGREYKTLFYAGMHVSSYDPEALTIRPSVDWALVDITASEQAKSN